MALLAGGTTVGRAIVVLVSPLLTRLYSPDEFGVLAVFSSLLMILGALVCLRYELAIPLPASERTAASLLVLCFILSAGLALLMGIVVWLLGDLLAAWLNVPSLAPYLWLLPAGLFCVGCYQALSYWAIRKQAFRRLARTRISQGIGQAAVQVGWGLAAGGPAGLLAGSVVGQAAGLGTLTATAYGDRRIFRTLASRSLRWAARRYRRFPFLALGSGLLNSSARQLPAILLAAIYGPQVAGWYGLSQRVLGAPMLLVGSAVSQVYVSEMPRLLRDDPKRLRRLFLGLTWRLLILGVLLLGAVGLAGQPIFRIVFGEEWGPAGFLAQVLVLNYLGQFVVGPVAQTLNVMERQDLHLLWNGVQLLMILLVFWLGQALDWSPPVLLGAYSATMFAGYVALFVLALSLITQRAAAATERSLRPQA